MASLRGKTPKTIAKRRLTAIRSKRSLHIIAVLMLAAVGSYLVVASRADTLPEDFINSELQKVNQYSATVYPYKNGMHSYEWAGYSDNDHSPLPPGTVVNTELHIESVWNRSGQPVAPRSAAVYMMSIDTKYLKLNSATCVWKYGCAINENYDLETAATAPQNRQYDWNLDDFCDLNSCWHKKKIVFCFTIPAGPPHVGRPPSSETLAALLQMQRTDREFRYSSSESMAYLGVGQILGSGCENNPELKGILWRSGDGFCGDPASSEKVKLVCDSGMGPGAAPGIFTGFGNGNGGTGTGTNGQGQGQGPSSGAGGGGSSAKKTADQPNNIPDSSSQGDNRQTELEPDPFFDGKDFEKGSDIDNLVFGNSTIGGKKVPKIALYIFSALLLGGAGGALYWRRKYHK